MVNLRIENMSKIFTDSPEKTKKMLLQVLGHQALVLSEPNVKSNQ